MKKALVKNVKKQKNIEETEEEQNRKKCECVLLPSNSHNVLDTMYAYYEINT